MRGRPRISGRLIIDSYQTLSHASVKNIQTSIPPTSQPPNKHMPVDQLGMNRTATASVIIYPPGPAVDDTKLTAGDITAMLARGDIR
jgi:hypothetical protein